MSYIIVSHHNLDVYYMATQPLLKFVTNKQKHYLTFITNVIIKNGEGICKTVDCSIIHHFIYSPIHPSIHNSSHKYQYNLQTLHNILYSIHTIYRYYNNISIFVFFFTPPLNFRRFRSIFILWNGIRINYRVECRFWLWYLSDSGHSGIW